MKKRRVAIVFLSCFIIAGLLFTGCTIPGTSGSTGGTQTTAKKIIVFQSKVEITDQMEALVWKLRFGVQLAMITSSS